jgi:endonuclease/exonuclease/phosphatase family metal-dependent hydrolase
MTGSVPARRWRAVLAMLLAACDGGSTSPAAPPLCLPNGVTVAGAAPAAVTVPAEGTATTFDVVTWNLEWFGDARPTFGPDDEARQLANVRDVIAGVDADLWGVQEVVGASQWSALLGALPGYAGLLAGDASVVDGPVYYTAGEQQVGILYKPSVFTMLGARVILRERNYEFGGRPPLEITGRVTLNGATQDLVVVVLHAKAFADEPSWQRREGASLALKAYLDATWPTQRVLVIGDFNDDVDTSITIGRPSPYRNFVADTGRYRFPTKALSDAGLNSTVGFSDVIDHQLASNETMGAYVAGSVRLLRPDEYVASYGTTTSDHYPVLTRWTVGDASSQVQLLAPNGGESLTGGVPLDVRWTSVAIGSVRLEYSVNDGVTWSAIVASTAAAPGSFRWLVPNVDAARVRLRIRDVASGVSDESDATFAIVRTAAGAGEVIVNEFLAHASSAGVDEEFVELLNAGGTVADIGGWTLADGEAVRHTFAAGATLAPGAALVIHTGLGALPGGALASAGALALDDAGDQLVLRDRLGVVRDAVSFGSTGAGISLNRSPEGSATGVFVPHTRLGACRASPGLRADGSAFD